MDELNIKVKELEEKLKAAKSQNQRKVQNKPDDEEHDLFYKREVKVEIMCRKDEI